MQEILVDIFLIVFYVIAVGIWFLTAIGLPGNWILAGLALLLTVIPSPIALTWTAFFWIIGLVIVGEIIESLLGMVLVAKKGGSKWGVLGSFLGGLIGVVLGGPIVPPLGSLGLGFVGAFAGAVVGEYMNERTSQEALRIGWWSFIGRALAIMGKVIAGVGILYIIVRGTW